MSESCFQMSVTAGCLTRADGSRETVNIHYEYRTSAAGNPVLHATRYTNAAGAAIALAVGESVTAGACAMIPPDVEWERLCDVSAAGVVTEFFRRTITSFTSNGTPSVAVVDFALDQLTAYVITGTVAECNRDCDVTAPVGLVTTWG